MIYTCFHQFSSMELVSQCIHAAKTRIWRFPHSAIPGHGPFCPRIPFRLRLEPLKPCLISLAFQRLPGPNRRQAGRIHHAARHVNRTCQLGAMPVAHEANPIRFTVHLQNCTTTQNRFGLGRHDALKSMECLTWTRENLTRN